MKDGVPVSTQVIKRIKFTLIESSRTPAKNSKAQTDSSSEDVFIDYYPLPAQFPGGDTAFTSFIKKNLTYPAEAREKNISGNVYIQFNVEIDGSITNIKVVKSSDPSLNQAAIDLMLKSPKWKPAFFEDDGRTIRSRVNRIIKFTLP